MSKKSSSNGIVLGYSRYSKGARNLASLLDMTLSYRDVFQHHAVTPEDTKIKAVINWGCTLAPPIKGRRNGFALTPFLPKIEKVINPLEPLTKAVNKKSFFTLMSKVGGPRIPEFTTDIDTAKAWASEGLMVMGRKEYITEGASKDIAFYEEDPAGFLSSDFWVQYKLNKRQFRLHFFGSDIFLAQEKVLPKNDPQGVPIPRDSVDYRIRTFRTGFIFQETDDVPSDVLAHAKKAVAILVSSGITFGAVDLVHSKSLDRAWVLNYKSTPVLDQVAQPLYVAKFKQHLGI